MKKIWTKVLIWISPLLVPEEREKLTPEQRTDALSRIMLLAGMVIGVILGILLGIMIGQAILKP